MLRQIVTYRQPPASRFMTDFYLKAFVNNPAAAAVDFFFFLFSSFFSWTAASLLSFR
jgi:hypothetical protein